MSHSFIKKLTQTNADYLSFFDLDWRFFFIFILFHIFIKRTYISLKEFSLVFSGSFVCIHDDFDSNEYQIGWWLISVNTSYRS